LLVSFLVDASIMPQRKTLPKGATEKGIRADAQGLETPPLRLGPKLPEIPDEHSLKLIRNQPRLWGLNIAVKSDEPKGSNQSAQAKHGWKKTWSFGDTAVFASYPNKQITAGGGGVVLTVAGGWLSSLSSLLRHSFLCFCFPPAEIFGLHCLVAEPW